MSPRRFKPDGKNPQRGVWRGVPAGRRDARRRGSPKLRPMRETAAGPPATQKKALTQKALLHFRQMATTMSSMFPGAKPGAAAEDEAMVRAEAKAIVAQAKKDQKIRNEGREEMKKTTDKVDIQALINKRIAQSFADRPKPTEPEPAPPAPPAKPDAAATKAAEAAEAKEIARTRRVQPEVAPSPFRDALPPFHRSRRRRKSTRSASRAARKPKTRRPTNSR